jgi:hypothetical protein
MGVYLNAFLTLEGHAVAQLVEALRHKPVGRWNFSLI